MTAAPHDLTSDMAVIEEHWQEGEWLRVTGQFSEAEWSQHQAISYAAMVVLGIDGIQQLCRQALTTELCSASS